MFDFFVALRFSLSKKGPRPSKQKQTEYCRAVAVGRGQKAMEIMVTEKIQLDTNEKSRKTMGNNHRQLKTTQHEVKQWKCIERHLKDFQ